MRRGIRNNKHIYRTTSQLTYTIHDLFSIFYNPRKTITVLLYFIMLISQFYATKVCVSIFNFTTFFYINLYKSSKTVHS